VKSLTKIRALRLRKRYVLRLNQTAKHVPLLAASP